jgi:hypothetical protein
MCHIWLSFSYHSEDLPEPSQLWFFYSCIQ